MSQTMAEKIYIIEDDDSIRELVRVTLDAFGYQVSAFDNAEDALAQMVTDIPDLAIFDIMLPKMDGLTAVKRLRVDERFRDLPIIMLTAKSAEIDKVMGLDAGADDYLAKPFGVLELSARIRSLLRRTQRQAPDRAVVVAAADIEMNTETREVRHRGALLELTLKEFELLRVLMENRGRVLSRDELLNDVWGYDYVGETRTLDMHIRALRQKLGDDADNPTYIKTIRSVGYRFVG